MTADQYACTEIVLEETPDAAVVANLGHASYVLAAVEDRPRNFYKWGSMGATTAVGLGLALSTDERVTVLEGDGSLLMSLGVLSTVGVYDPANLTVVCFDNREYGTTGGQPTHVARDVVELAGVARECGVESQRVTDADDFAAAYEAAVEHDGATFIDCAVEPVDPDARPPFDYAHIARRVRRSLTGEE